MVCGRSGIVSYMLNSQEGFIRISKGFCLFSIYDIHTPKKQIKSGICLNFVYDGFIDVVFGYQFYHITCLWTGKKPSSCKHEKHEIPLGRKLIQIFKGNIDTAVEEIITTRTITNEFVTQPVALSITNGYVIKLLNDNEGIIKLKKDGRHYVWFHKSHLMEPVSHLSSLLKKDVWFTENVVWKSKWSSRFSWATTSKVSSIQANLSGTNSSLVTVSNCENPSEIALKLKTASMNRNDNEFVYLLTEVDNLPIVYNTPPRVETELNGTLQNSQSTASSTSKTVELSERHLKIIYNYSAQCAPQIINANEGYLVNSAKKQIIWFHKFVCVKFDDMSQMGNFHYTCNLIWAPNDDLHYAFYEATCVWPNGTKKPASPSTVNVENCPYASYVVLALREAIKTKNSTIFVCIESYLTTGEISDKNHKLCLDWNQTHINAEEPHTSSTPIAEIPPAQGSSPKCGVVLKLLNENEGIIRYGESGKHYVWFHKLNVTEPVSDLSELLRAKVWYYLYEIWSSRSGRSSWYFAVNVCISQKYLNVRNARVVTYRNCPNPSTIVKELRAMVNFANYEEIVNLFKAVDAINYHPSQQQFENNFIPESAERPTRHLKEINSTTTVLRTINAKEGYLVNSTDKRIVWFHKSQHQDLFEFNNLWYTAQLVWAPNDDHHYAFYQSTRVWSFGKKKPTNCPQVNISNCPTASNVVIVLREALRTNNVQFFVMLGDWLATDSMKDEEHVLFLEKYNLIPKRSTNITLLEGSKNSQFVESKSQAVQDSLPWMSSGEVSEKSSSANELVDENKCTDYASSQSSRVFENSALYEDPWSGENSDEDEDDDHEEDISVLEELWAKIFMKIVLKKMNTEWKYVHDLLNDSSSEDEVSNIDDRSEYSDSDNCSHHCFNHGCVIKLLNSNEGIIKLENDGRHYVWFHKSHLMEPVSHLSSLLKQEVWFTETVVWESKGSSWATTSKVSSKKANLSATNSSLVTVSNCRNPSKIALKLKTASMNRSVNEFVSLLTEVESLPVEYKTPPLVETELDRTSQNS